MDPNELFIAACEWLNLLEKDKFDVNGIMDYNGELHSPLYVAISKRNTPMVKLLLDNGAKRNYDEDRTNNFLNQVIWLENVTMVKFLLKEGLVDNLIDESFGYTCKRLVRFSNREPYGDYNEDVISNCINVLNVLSARKLELLLCENRETQIQYKYYAICKAIVESDTATALAIIESLNCVDFPGIENDSQPLALATLLHQYELIKALLNKGSSWSYSIGYAVWMKDLEAISIFLDNVPDEITKSERAKKALRWCCHGGFMDGLKLLIQQGFALSVEEYVDQVTEVECIETWKVFKYLLEHQQIDCAQNLLKNIENNNDENCGKHGCVYSLLLENGAFSCSSKLEENITIHQRCTQDDKCHVLMYFKKINLIDERYGDDGLVPMLVDIRVNDWKKIKYKGLGKFKKELNRLQEIILNVSTSFNPSHSLFDILMMEPSGVSRLIPNINLQKIYKENNGDFRKNYPYYGTILNIKYKKGVERRNSTDTAAELLNEALGWYLTEEMLECIFQNFSNSELAKWKLASLE